MSRPEAAAGALVHLLLAPGTLVFLIPWWITRWVGTPPFDGARVLGALLITAGTAVLLESFARFVLEGEGTPAPVAPTKRLVVSGLYRWVRNPMYMGALAAVAGQALAFGSMALAGYGAVLWLAFHLFIIFYEEPTLDRAFGDEYATFRAAVPRWLPRLRPWRDG